MDFIPNDLKKLKDMGIFNVIWEIDLGDAAHDWDHFSINDFCALMQVGLLGSCHRVNKIGENPLWMNLLFH